MKKFQTIFIYALVAALLGGYIYFFERGPVKKKDEEKKLKVFEKFVADDITQIHLENLGTTVTAEKSPIDIEKDEKGVWQILTPKKLKADESMVRTLLTGVGDYVPDSNIENPTNLAEFGLDKPAAKSLFKTKSGTAFEITVGDKNAAGTDNYVQTADKKYLFLIPTTSLDSLKKNVDEFRDHSVMKTDLVLAQKLSVTRDGKVITLEKDKDNVWNIVDPIEEKADEAKVRDILNTVNGIRIESFVKDQADNLASYGLAKPRAQIKVWPSDGTGAKTILLGRKKDKFPSFYAKTGDLPAVYLVAEYVEKTTDVKLKDFRDKSAMKFDAGVVTGFTVKRGAKSWIYQKGDKGQWVAEGRAAANEEGVNVLGQLSGIVIQDYADKKASTGLNDPAFVVELTMADKTTRVFRFGKREQSQVYLASDKTKDVYLVSSSIISQLEVYFSAVLTPVPAAPAAQMIKK